MRRVLRKALSGALAVIVCVLNCCHWAMAQSGSETEESESLVQSVSYEEPEVLYEVEDRREAAAKHFRMSDDSYIAVQYGYQGNRFFGLKAIINYSDGTSEVHDIYLF